MNYRIRTISTSDINVTLPEQAPCGTTIVINNTAASNGAHIEYYACDGSKWHLVDSEWNLVDSQPSQSSRLFYLDESGALTHEYIDKLDELINEVLPAYPGRKIKELNANKKKGQQLELFL